MLLKILIKNLPKEKKKIKVKGLALNSKNVKKDFIFFAIKGYKTNGEKFIKEAIKRGASVIICSKNCKYKNKSVAVLKTSDIRYLLSEISSKYYRLKPKNIIAVTGTNGKTSVADLFYQILKLNKIPVASIGTLGIKLREKIIKSNLTSPDTILLHKSLDNIKRKKIDNVIIEASSHGLEQKRLEHLNLKAGIFTNFSQDHLDYHKTMKSYLNAKMHLFKNVISPKKTIILDKSIKEYSILKKISKSRSLRLIDINKTKDKLEKVIGNRFNDFQKKNLSMAVEAAKQCNLKEKKIFRSLRKINDINGRLELIKTFSNNIKVFVDFAHTPDALSKSIIALKNSYKSDLSVVFGCGGDRDFKKRPLMAKVANTYCKNIYVTDDNPRNEKPEKIRKEIVKNINNNNYFNIANRAKAIKTAIKNAEPNELILVAGKGHEDQQIYKNKTINISDKEIIKNLKIKRKKISNQSLNFEQNKEIIKKLKKISVKNFHGLSIDSRTIKKDNIFLTIKGRNNNGVKFASKALKKGGKYIVSSKNIKKHKRRLIKVDNEFNFLNYFASQKREKSRAKIIAVTGSAGKTSLKNLIKDQLDSFGKTLCSPKSFNNNLGVPLSLSQLNMNHQFAVFEVGMSKAGEIHSLSKLIKPHIGIITNIGEAHIENFKNLNGIAKAKGEIINNIKENGTLILNRDDKYFNYFKKRAKLKNLRVVSFGISKKSDVYPVSFKRNKKEKKLTLKICDQILKIKVKNLNIHNILATLTLLKVLNLNFFESAYRFVNFQPSEGRGKIYNVKRYKKNFKLIDESYNANPLSVKNAIKNFQSIQKEKFKKYLILGDMLELGKKSELLHKNLSKVINNSDIDKVFIKGENTLTTYKNLYKEKRGNIFQQEEDVDFTLNKIIANNDYLMIKGSNATGLNNLTKKIVKGY
jgi:murE/murF fusion protein